MIFQGRNCPDVCCSGRWFGAYNRPTCKRDAKLAPKQKKGPTWLRPKRSTHSSPRLNAVPSSMRPTPCATMMRRSTSCRTSMMKLTELCGQAGRRAADAVHPHPCRTPSSTISAAPRRATSTSPTFPASVALTLTMTSTSSKSSNRRTARSAGSAAGRAGAKARRWRHRRSAGEVAGASTGSVPAALLGRYGYCRDGCRHGLLGGSVKTHCSRAVHALQGLLRQKGITL